MPRVKKIERKVLPKYVSPESDEEIKPSPIKNTPSTSTSGAHYNDASDTSDASVSNASGDDDESEDEDETATSRLVEDESTRTEIRKELSNLTFEELLALKEKLGTKEYNEAMFGNPQQSGSHESGKQIKRQIKRDNKNRPREMSSKVRVPVVREIVPVPKKLEAVKKDPRFEADYGKLNEQLWNTNYSFLRDMAKDEQKNLKQRFKEDKTIDEAKKAKIKTYLQRLSNKEKSSAKKEEDETKRRAAKKERLQQISEGKKPYYMKKSTKKYVELAEKYDELKAKGKIDGYLKKKRAKNASRDKKILKL